LSYLDQYVKSTKGQPHFDAEGVREGVIKLLEKLQKTPMDLSSYPNAAAAILDLQLDDLDHYVRFMKDRPYYDTESVRENAIKLIKKLKDTPMDLSPYPNAAAVLSDAYRNNLQNRQDVA
jgi:cytochrome c556